MVQQVNKVLGGALYAIYQVINIHRSIFYHPVILDLPKPIAS